MLHHFSKTLLIDIESVDPNPFNFRLDLSPMSLNGLARSIAERGLIHPILVRPHPEPGQIGQYQIVCGERRFSAVKLLCSENPDDWKTIPARVEALDDTQALSAMLQENELRQDWTPYERAAFFRAIYDDEHFPSIRRMAKAFGIGLTTLHRYLRVFDLPESIIQHFRTDALSIALIEVILESPEDIRVDLAEHLATHPCNKAKARRIARQMQQSDLLDWIDSATDVLQDQDCELRITDEDELKIEFAGKSTAELAGKLKQAASRLEQNLAS